MVDDIRVFQHNINIRVDVVKERTNKIRDFLHSSFDYVDEIQFNVEQIKSSKSIYLLHGIDPNLREHQLQLTRFGRVVEAFSTCGICFRHYRDHVLEGHNKVERNFRLANLSKSVSSFESKVTALLPNLWDMMDSFITTIKPLIESLKHKLLEA